MLASCRYHFDELGDGRLISGDRPMTTLGGCWPVWFDGTVRLTGLRQLTETSTGFTEIDPSLSRDGLTLYFARGMTGSRDVYVTTRPDVLSMFAAPTMSAELSSPQDDAKVSFTRDGLVMALTSDRTGSQAFDIWELTRTITTDTFANATQTPYAAIETASNEYDVHLSDDGLRVYYSASLLPGQEIRMATRATVADAFGPPTKVLGLPYAVTADAELSPDELLIAFNAQVNVGDVGQMYYATRSAIGDPFQSPQPIPDVNSVTTLDGDPQLTDDGCNLVFDSIRTGNRELFTATVQ